ncbi:DUF2845 domain-containing protein [Pseudomonas sp. BN415]|uniref:DUF2845 domain-containing protein n=1 Tax=Pseudomonas sp. BN415 TaxID=2567889 RepID=UPI002454B7D2|nr:DUF2845 domain-containing protein [Pseudomonas sp. BN415]MDH4580474.1 DUF2845 domain-containing protein [Pseudomonas sp. BN415]
MKALVCLFATALLLASEANASTFRCESKLVSVGDRSVEVQRKCGDPASRSFIGYTETSSGRQEMQTEEWVYGPSNGMYYYLRFVGGRLNQIDSKRD